MNIHGFVPVLRWYCRCVWRTQIVLTSPVLTTGRHRLLMVVRLSEQVWRWSESGGRREGNQHWAPRSLELLDQKVKNRKELIQQQTCRGFLPFKETYEDEEFSKFIPHIWRNIILLSVFVYLCLTCAIEALPKMVERRQPKKKTLNFGLHKQQNLM